MYPPETSLIPVTVSLIRYFSEKGMGAFFTNYPYWYLGSTPFKYLMGPIIPFAAEILKQIIPSDSYFDVLLVLVYASVVAGGVGWLMLVRRIYAKDGINFGIMYYAFAALIYYLTPFKYVGAFAIDEATFTVARNMIPFVIFALWVHLRRRSVVSFAFASLSVALILLTNTNIIGNLIVGIVGLCLTISFKKGKIINLTRRLKRSGYVLLTGFAIATVWYGPGFWVTQLSNPGIGGVAGAAVILKLFEFLKNVAPLVFAVLVIKLSHKITSRMQVFALSWLLVFLSATIYRFLANPAFWMDYSKWFNEVEVGLFLLTLTLLSPFKRGAVITILLTTFVASFCVYNALGWPKLINKTAPIATESLELLNGLNNGSKIYITGSNVFWLNSALNVIQVRGGRDEVSRLPGWVKDSYTIRENTNENEIRHAVKRLGIDYILINSENSFDFYHDYKNLSSWEEVGAKVAEKNGDILLKPGSN